MTTDNGLVRREQLERQANIVRSRLAAYLGALTRRRQRVLDWRKQARQYVPELVAAGISTFLLLTGGMVLKLVRKRRRASHLYRERWMALGRAWKSPQHVAAYQDRSIVAEIGRKFLISLVTFIGSRLAKRALRHRVLPSSQASQASQAREIPATV
jgi:hypothetical protein